MKYGQTNKQTKVIIHIYNGSLLSLLSQATAVTLGDMQEIHKTKQIHKHSNHNNSCLFQFRKGIVSKCEGGIITLLFSFLKTYPYGLFLVFLPLLLSHFPINTTA